MRVVVSFAVVALSPGSALAQPSRATCTTEQAIYEAEKGSQDKFKPDEMWFDYKHTVEWEPWAGFPGGIRFEARECSRNALLLLEQAIGLDPGYPQALGMKAWITM